MPLFLLEKSVTHFFANRDDLSIGLQFLTKQTMPYDLCYRHLEFAPAHLALTLVWKMLPWLDLLPYTNLLLAQWYQEL